MKVNFTENAKKFITIAEAPKVREIIENMKCENIEELATIAAHVAGCGGYCEILKATAEIAKNARVYNFYGDGTNDIDVWLECYAFNEFDGFFEIGAYVSDLWQVSGDNVDETRGHMFIRAYEYVQRGRKE